jgi:tRNA G26 N,N-dimethylase Trm1
MPSNLTEYYYSDLRRDLNIGLHPADLISRLRAAGYIVTRIKNNSFSTNATIEQIQEVVSNG